MAEITEIGGRGVSRKQAEAIQIFLNNRSKSKARVLREAGYGESVARQPHKVFASPAVIRELDKRGYDELGIRVAPHAKSESEPVRPKAQPIDLSQMPPEKIQDLKELLRAVPSRQEENHSYVPTGGGVDIFNDYTMHTDRVADTASLSSM